MLRNPTARLMTAGFLASAAIPFLSVMPKKDPLEHLFGAEADPFHFTGRDVSPRRSRLYEKPPLSMKHAKARAATKRQRGARRQTRLHLK